MTGNRDGRCRARASRVATVSSTVNRRAIGPVDGRHALHFRHDLVAQGLERDDLNTDPETRQPPAQLGRVVNGGGQLDRAVLGLG